MPALAMAAAAYRRSLPTGEQVSLALRDRPHFFTPTGGYFCPALDVSRDASGHLRVAANPATFDEFVASCFV